ERREPAGVASRRAKAGCHRAGVAVAARRALLDALSRRLYRPRHAGAGARAGSDVAQFSARLHRRAVLRPRRLFRPRRLWRRARAQIPHQQHPARAHPRHAAWRCRRRGVYFAMVTIAFGQVFYYIAFQWSSLTGGDDGLRGFSRQPLHLGLATVDILSNGVAFYYFVLLCFAIAAAAMAFLLRSPFGRTLLAIRENERRARFLGIPVELHIWLAFVISCFFIALAGGLDALLNNFANPRELHYSQSGDFVIMAVMGGMRS